MSCARECCNGLLLLISDVSGDGTDYSTILDCSLVWVTKAKHDAHPEELARMDGARLAFASGSARGKRWDENRIKALTGGDKITARYLRQNSFALLPQTKLVIIGNNQPSLSDVDTAIKRRFRRLRPTQDRHGLALFLVQVHDRQTTSV